MSNAGEQIFQICSDSVGKTVEGDFFVACDFCSLPACRPCYEHERKDGNRSCPQCKTKRHKDVSGEFSAASPERQFASSSIAANRRTMQLGKRGSQLDIGQCCRRTHPVFPAHLSCFQKGCRG